VTAQESAAAERAAREDEALQLHLQAERGRIIGLQRLQQAEEQTKQAAAQLYEYGQQNFSDIASAEDLERLRKTDPGRHRALMLLNERATQVFKTAREIGVAKQHATSEGQARQRAEQAARREAMNVQQDQLAEEAIQKAIPEVPLPEIRRAAKEMLKKTGVSESVIKEHWLGRPLDMRNPHIQTILAKASMWDRAQERSAEVRRSIADKRVQDPQPLKPGVAGHVVASRDAGDINQIKAALKTAKGKRALELGTQLQQARRGRQ
jgi:hypothetical protein